MSSPVIFNFVLSCFVLVISIPSVLLFLLRATMIDPLNGLVYHVFNYLFVRIEFSFFQMTFLVSLHILPTFILPFLFCCCCNRYTFNTVINLYKFLVLTYMIYLYRVIELLYRVITFIVVELVTRPHLGK